MIPRLLGAQASSEGWLLQFCLPVGHFVHTRGKRKSISIGISTLWVTPCYLEKKEKPLPASGPLFRNCVCAGSSFKLEQPRSRYRIPWWRQRKPVAITALGRKRRAHYWNSDRLIYIASSKLRPCLTTQTETNESEVKNPEPSILAVFGVKPDLGGQE